MNNKMKRFTTTKKLKQQGMTLIIAMVMLVVITGIGVNAVKLSTSDTLIANNDTLKMLVFQGAESAIAASATSKNLHYVKKSAERGGPPVDVVVADEDVSNGVKLVSKTKVRYMKKGACPPISGFANSVIFECHLFEIDANSSVMGAKAQHIEGKAILSPPTK